MSKIVDAARRVLGRSVRDLAGEVDEALGRLAQARGLEAAATDALRLAQQDVAQAEADVAAARDALFAEHPDLRPPGSVTVPLPNYVDVEGQPLSGKVTVSATPANPQGFDLDPSKFEVVEVDDDNDPRFTAGAPAVSPDDNEPLPPIVWGEHDG